jgi:cytochrome b6-f complex iron-sulfur subunit
MHTESAPRERASRGATSAPATVRIALSEFPENGRKVLWLGDVPVEVRRGPDGIEARSLLCTHFGCPVKWDEANQRYACPCHNGMFDAAGEVIGGPPLKPLRRVPVVRSGAEVLVGAEVSPR